MPTLNERIAKVKGWEHVPPQKSDGRLGCETWYTPDRQRRRSVSDWVGTLEGVAELMRELDGNVVGNQSWIWRFNKQAGHPPGAYCCERHDYGYLDGFLSNSDRPGDCIALAWLSVKENVE